MQRFKTLAILLLFVLCTTILVPAPAYAAAPTGVAGTGFLATVISLLSELFHLDLNNLNVPSTTTPVQAQVPVPAAKGKKDVLGFYAEWWGTDTASFEDLKKHSDAIGTIAPFWATLQGDGTVSDRGGNDHASVVNYAKGKNITTLLMVNNAKQSNPDEGIHAVLSNSSLRKKAIDNLESRIKQYGLQGVNIDFEEVPARDRDNLTAFMKELSSRLKPQGYLVTIDVFPKHNEANDIAVAYDYAQLAQFADRIILMTYDYHGTWSNAGAVADLSSVERDLKYALTMIPKSKIYLGVAGYGYDWSSKGVESLEYSAIQNLINRFGADVQWDEAAKSPHFSYTGPDGVEHQVWYENSQSLQYKLNLVNQYDIAGIALWKLSEEDPQSWQVIKKFLN